MPDASTTFRTGHVEPAPPPKKKEPSDTKVPGDIVRDVEAPYLDYETLNGHPYLVDHFELGDRWQDPVGGYPKELAIIEGYIEDKIKTGGTGNDITSAKEILKEAEKMTNTKKETRLVIKLPIIAAYMKFLMEADKIKFDAQRYASPR